MVIANTDKTRYAAIFFFIGMVSFLMFIDVACSFYFDVVFSN